MELISADVEAKTKYTAHDIFSIPAGKRLRIEGDDNILKSDKVSTGKVWSVDVHVSITETDV